MKRLALLLLLACLVAPMAWCADGPVEDLFKQAKDANAASKWDEALGLYERVITEHPEACDRWFSAQQGITSTLVAKGNLAEAAKSAHLALDCASGAQYFDSAVMLTANILSALDKNVDRANQLLAFQETGPVAGAVNPLDAVGYPAMPERERAFSAMRQQAGDSANASRLRGYTFLFTGKPREALAQFADAFRRSSNLYNIQTAGAGLTNGLRAVRGHRVGLEKSVTFVIFGPNGPDGKPNTEDDVADPFTELLPASPAAGQGGLTGASAEDLQALRQLRDAAKLYASDPWVRGDLRRAATSSMSRLNDALDDWGSPGQKEFFFAIGNTHERALRDPALDCAIGAAKGRALHLGGVQALWGEFKAYCTAQGSTAGDSTGPNQDQFNKICVGGLNKNSAKAPPSFKRLQKPATKF